MAAGTLESYAVQIALNYLRPVDYYKGNPEVLLAERERKLKTAGNKRKVVNRLILTETMTSV